MRILNAELGGETVLIYAPAVGEFDRDEFLASFPAGGMYGMDVESTFMDDLKQFSPDFRLRLIQFGTVGYSWVLNMDDPSQRAAAIELLSNNKVRFCSHTNMDVLAVATQLGIDITRQNWDVHVLAVMAAPDDKDGGKDLKTLATNHNMPELEEAEKVMEARFKALWADHVDARRREEKIKGLSKAYGSAAKTYAWNTISVDDETYLVYAGLDSIAVRRLVPILVYKTQAPRVLLEQEMWLAGASNRKQIKGALIDQKTLHELHQESEEATEKANSVVRAHTGLNASQTAKLIDWFDNHGADWADHPKTKTGRPSLAKDSLGLLLGYPLDDVGRTVAEKLLDVQAHADARMKTQGVINALAPDGRVHSTLKTVGTVTARMSSSGPNEQNFSKKEPRVRGAYIPDPGCVLISCDFAQIELRVAAALAQETKMIDAINRGDDLHQLTADLIGVNRDIGKMTNFLIVYGGGARALSEKAGIDYNLARQTVVRFWETYPYITRQNDFLKEITTSIRTVSGRRIPVGRDGNGFPRSYANLNYMIQSSARDLIVGAWRRFDQAGYGHLIWNLIHDEMVIQAPEEQAEEICRIAAACMKRDFLGVPIEADAVILRDKNGVSRWGKG